MYKPVTQGGHMSKTLMSNCNPLLTQPKSSDETAFSKRCLTCHATSSQFPLTKADTVLNYICDLSAPTFSSNRRQKLFALLSQQGPTLLSFPQSSTNVSQQLSPDYLSRDNNLIGLPNDGCVPCFAVRFGTTSSSSERRPFPTMCPASRPAACLFRVEG